MAVKSINIHPKLSKNAQIYREKKLYCNSKVRGSNSHKKPFKAHRNDD